MRVRARLSVRNDAIASACERFKTNQTGLAKLAGVSPTTISAIATMNFRRIGERTILTVAAALGIPTDELVPESARSSDLRVHAERVMDVEPKHLLAWKARAERFLLQGVEADESAALRERIEAALDSLSDTERTVLSMRYGLAGEDESTLDEVAHRIGRTRERVRQTEAKAIRKLQHPARATALEGFLQ